MSERDYDTRTIDELAQRRNLFSAPVDEPHEQLRLTLLELDGEPAKILELGLYDRTIGTVIDKLRDGTHPIPGRDGWRVDADGHEWYSSAWLGLYE